jgi:hypothetical protein
VTRSIKATFTCDLCETSSPVEVTVDEDGRALVLPPVRVLLSLKQRHKKSMDVCEACIGAAVDRFTRILIKAKLNTADIVVWRPGIPRSE